MIVDAAYEAYQDAGIEDPQQQIEAVFCGARIPSQGHGRGRRRAQALRPAGEHGRRTTAPPAPTRSATASSRSPAGCTTRCWSSASTSRRTAASPARASQSPGVRGLPATPGRLVLALRRAVLRDLRRRARGPREDRRQEPPQRHARAEVDAEARDHGRGRAERAHHLVAVRPLRLRRAVRRRRRRDHHAPRAGQELPRRLRAGARRSRIALAPNPQEDPDFDFLRWKPTDYAAQQVYAQAGITNPRKEIHVAQVHDCFTLTELLAYEDLGLLREGRGQGAHRAAARSSSAASCR